jgi:hypothetical protein
MVDGLLLKFGDRLIQLLDLLSAFDQCFDFWQALFADVFPHCLAIFP